MMKRLLFLYNLQLLEGAIRLRYDAFQFHFFMSDFFVFLNILTGDLFVQKTSSPRSERDEKEDKALKNSPRLDFSRQDPKKPAPVMLFGSKKKAVSAPTTKN